MKTLFIVTVFVLICSSAIFYHDFLIAYPLNNPDLTSSGTGLNSPEIQLSSDETGIKVAGFYMRSPSRDFSHFIYELNEGVIYISGYTKPRAIFFERKDFQLSIPLSTGTYDVYYLNTDKSRILMKTVSI